MQRDLEALVDGVTAWLRHRHDDPVEVTDVDRPTEGWSSETVLVHAAIGGRTTGIAIRLAPVGDGIFPTYDLGLQARAQTAAAGAGVPAPAPTELVDDPTWLGDPFLAMPLVEGHVPAAMAAFDPWVQALDVDHQRRLHHGVVDALAQLHGADLTSVDLPRRSVDDELAWWRSYLDWYATPDEAVPALADALDTCARHRPDDEPPAALLWGDVRLGNVVFDDDASVAAVLDWEMATVGAPEHDLAWWWALEAMQDDLVGGRAEGFPSIDELRTRYEAGAGRSLQHLDWYEAFALFRSATILTRIGILQQRAGAPTQMALDDNPVLDRLAEDVSALDGSPARRRP